MQEVKPKFEHEMAQAVRILRHDYYRVTRRNFQRWLSRNSEAVYWYCWKEIGVLCKKK